MYLRPFLYLPQKAAKTSSKMYSSSKMYTSNSDSPFLVLPCHPPPPQVFLVDTAAIKAYKPGSASKNYLSPPVATLLHHPYPFRIWNYEELYKAQMIPQSTKLTSIFFSPQHCHCSKNFNLN